MSKCTKCMNLVREQIGEHEWLSCIEGWIAFEHEDCEDFVAMDSIEEPWENGFCQSCAHLYCTNLCDIRTINGCGLSCEELYDCISYEPIGEKR